MVVLDVIAMIVVFAIVHLVLIIHRHDKREHTVVDRHTERQTTKQASCLPQTNPALSGASTSARHDHRSEIAAPETLVARQNAHVNSFNLCHSAATRTGTGTLVLPSNHSKEVVFLHAPSIHLVTKSPANCPTTVALPPSASGQRHAIPVSTVSKYRNLTPTEPKFATSSSHLRLSANYSIQPKCIPSGVTASQPLHVSMSQHVTSCHSSLFPYPP